MARIQQVVFFLGGVLVPRFSQAVLAHVSEPSIEMLRHLQHIEIQLSLGKMTAAQVADQMAPWLEREGDSGEWLEQMIGDLKCTPGMRPILDNLAQEQQLAVIVDFPGEWGDDVIDQSGLADYYNEGNRIYLDAHRSSKTYGELFTQLVAEERLVPGQSLLIDHHPLRTAAALKAGLDAAIFVTADRLERDLSLLWGMY